MKEKHPRNQPRNNNRGSEEADHKYIFNNYKLEIIGKQKDQLGAFILEGLKIKKEHPTINGMSGNGFVR